MPRMFPKVVNSTKMPSAKSSVSINMSDMEHVTEEPVMPKEDVPPGLHLAASDVEEFVGAFINFYTGPEAEAAGRKFYYGELEYQKRIRLMDWHKIKDKMGAEEFAKIGYCPDCAVEAGISFRKDINTKCSRHAAASSE